ncbi:MAG: hypothetical protein ABSH52_13680 [Terriglobia bacterium]
MLLTWLIYTLVLMASSKQREMRVTLLTFCYLGIRPDRPDGYYITPLNDYVQRILPHSSSFALEVYTSREHVNRIGSLPFGRVLSLEPEELMAEVWDDPEALDAYHNLIQRNPTHSGSYQARFRRLIAVYLAKVAAIRKTFLSGCDACFWFDSGHWISYQAGHDLSQYRPQLQDGVTANGLSERLLDAAARYGVVGSQALPGKKKFHMPLAWMHEYGPELGYNNARDLPFCSAVFWLVHRNSVELFFTRFQHWWLRLLADGKAGIEENALTLMTWEQRCHVATYDTWVQVLRGGNLPRFTGM